MIAKVLLLSSIGFALLADTNAVNTPQPSIAIPSGLTTAASTKGVPAKEIPGKEIQVKGVAGLTDTAAAKPAKVSKKAKAKKVALAELGESPAPAPAPVVEHWTPRGPMDVNVVGPVHIAPDPLPSAPTYVAGDSVRIPYQANRIYYIRIVAGAPVMVELPLGETVKNIWIDKNFFSGEAVPGGSRVLLKALPAEDVDGKKTFVHIETRNDLRFSAELECVSSGDHRGLPPGVYTFYLTGQDEEVSKRNLIQQQASAQAEEYQNGIDAKNKAVFSGWQADAMEKMHDQYKVNGPLPVRKVVDNGVQTWIFITGVYEINSLKVINRDKKEEVVDFEFVNGAYTANRILKEGERFELDNGKEKTQIVRR